MYDIGKQIQVSYKKVIRLGTRGSLYYFSTRPLVTQSLCSSIFRAEQTAPRARISPQIVFQTVLSTSANRDVTFIKFSNYLEFHSNSEYQIFPNLKIIDTVESYLNLSSSYLLLHLSMTIRMNACNSQCATIKHIHGARIFNKKTQNATWFSTLHWYGIFPDYISAPLHLC